MSAEGQSSTASSPAPARTSYGFLFQSIGPEGTENENDVRLGNDVPLGIYTRFYYVPLNDVRFSNTHISNWRETNEIEIQADVPATHYHPTPLNFSYLIAESRDNKLICATDRGLILISLRSSYTYDVYNPFNGQRFHLPSSPSLPGNPEERERRYNLEDAAIINFSPGPQRNFKVIRIYRRNGRCAEVYWSNTGQWVTHNLGLPNDICSVKWCVSGAVVLDNTLFILTNRNCAVRVTFSPDEDGIIVCPLLDVPQSDEISFDHSALHGSQGFLYFSCYRRGYLGIWKLNGSPQHAEDWIPLFIFNNNSDNPPKSRAEEYLRGIYQNRGVTEPLNMHPERPIVYLYDRPSMSIVAFHLLNNVAVDVSNDEVDKIELETNPLIFPRDFHLFSPCSVLLEH